MRAGSPSHTPLFFQSLAPFPAFSNHSVLSTPKHFSIVIDQKFLKGCNWLFLTSPFTLVTPLYPSKSSASHIHCHSSSLLSLKDCDCPIRWVLLNMAPIHSEVPTSIPHAMSIWQERSGLINVVGLSSTSLSCTAMETKKNPLDYT